MLNITCKPYNAECHYAECRYAECRGALAKSVALFKKLHFLRKLQIGSISYGVCPWQAFIAWCNVTLSLIAVIRNLQRKLSVVNTAPGGKHL
jgi:hypothetical protein